MNALRKTPLISSPVSPRAFQELDGPYLPSIAIVGEEFRTRESVCLSKAKQLANNHGAAACLVGLSAGHGLKSSIQIDALAKLDGLEKFMACPVRAEFGWDQLLEVLPESHGLIREKRSRPPACEVTRRCSATVIVAAKLSLNQIISVLQMSRLNRTIVLDEDSIDRLGHKGGSHALALTPVAVMTAAAAKMWMKANSMQDALDRLKPTRRNGVIAVVDQGRMFLKTADAVTECTQVMYNPGTLTDDTMFAIEQAIQIAASRMEGRRDEAREARLNTFEEFHANQRVEPFRWRV